MPPIERSFADVLQDIVHNVQDIIRSEIRLAKVEVREEIRNARPAITTLFIALLLGVFAVLFLLMCALYALSDVMPPWGAALTLSALLALAAIAAGVSGAKQIGRAKTVTPKTVPSRKENIEWTKQQIK
jgi:uncharacterized membrane protein YqjE